MNHRPQNYDYTTLVPKKGAPTRSPQHQRLRREQELAEYRARQAAQVAESSEAGQQQTAGAESSLADGWYSDPWTEHSGKRWRWLRNGQWTEHTA